MTKSLKINNNNHLAPLPHESKTSRRQGFSGFTLAETLVTLIIIGLIAVIVLPMLKSNVDDKTIEKQKDVFTSKFQEGLRQMQINNALTEDYASTGEFIDAMRKYIKIEKVCDANKLAECFPNVKTSKTVTKYNFQTTNISKATDLGANPTKWADVELKGIVFSDGSSGIIGYRPGCSITGRFDSSANLKECFCMMYDSNGKNGPNLLGMDIDTYNIRYDGKDFEIGEIRTSTSYSHADCVNAKDAGAPINACREEGYLDFWAYAVDTCYKEDKRLPTRQELKEIAKQVYGVDNVNSGAGSTMGVTNLPNGVKDNDLWTQIGGPVSLWSSEPSSANGAWYWVFKTDGVEDTCYANYWASKEKAGIKFFCVD